MNTKDYLRILAKEIKVTSARNDIIREYEEHIEDHKDALLKKGLSEAEATEEALQQLGDPIILGEQLNSVHRRGIEWGMAGYYLVWALVLNVVPSLLGSSLFMSETPDFIRFGIAGILVIVGFSICFLEKYSDTSLFYAWADNWNGGGLVNSGLILAIAIVPLRGTTAILLLWIIVIGGVLICERYVIALLRDQKEQRLLWTLGVALTDISYKGQGVVDGKKIYLRSNKEPIRKGSPFVIIGLEGFKPVAMGI